MDALRLPRHLEPLSVVDGMLRLISKAGEDGGRIMTTTKAAWQLHTGDVVLPDSGSPPRVVLGAPRLQGSPALALVEFAGMPGRTHYPATQMLTVETLR